MIQMKDEVLTSEKRIRSLIRKTPLDYSIALSKETESHVYLKCENLQYTGSFKVRGAMNKLLSLTQKEREQGVVTASSGNHGAAVSFGLKHLNIRGKVFVPENASTAKIANIRNYDVSLALYGTDCMQTEFHAREYAKENNMIYVSPYNDLQVIAGQGTLGAELLQQLKEIDAIFVPIGGGGLIAGIAGFIKTMTPKTKIIGCLPANSPVMAESIKAGKIIEMETLPTLSDATAGGIEPGSITFEMCQQWVDDYCLVSETDIGNAILTLIKTQHLLVEGASGVALAAFLKNPNPYRNKNIVILLSGANISIETLFTLKPSC